MNARYRTIARHAALGLFTLALALAGCGPNTTNDESIGATSKVAPQRTDMPNFKSEGEYQAWLAKKQAEDNPAGKGRKKASPKPAPKPAPKTEESKTDAKAP
jgi:hypothetical protein